MASHGAHLVRARCQEGRAGEANCAGPSTIPKAFMFERDKRDRKLEIRPLSLPPRSPGRGDRVVGGRHRGGEAPWFVFARFCASKIVAIVFG